MISSRSVCACLCFPIRRAMSVLNSLTTLSSGYYTALIVCLTHVTQGAKYSCQASASVPEGSVANISCYFSENVQVTKKNVKIHKIAGEFEPDGVVVAECFWSDAQNFKCDQQGGYRVQGEITNRAMLAIPRATKAFEGKYMCELVPSEPSDIEPCEFRLAERDDAININLSIPDMRLLIIVAIAISLVSLVIVIVILMFFLKDRIIACLSTQRSASKNRRSRKSGENVKKGEENVPLKAMDYKVEEDDTSIDINDTILSNMRNVVDNSVRSALLEVAQTDAGAMVISTMSEIQRKWQLRKIPPSNDQAQQSTSRTSQTHHPRDSRGSGSHGALANEYVNMKTQEETYGTKSDKGTVVQAIAPVAVTEGGEGQSGNSTFYVNNPSGVPGPPGGEGNVTRGKVTQDPKSKKLQPKGSSKGQVESPDTKKDKTPGNKNKKWYHTFTGSKSSNTSKNNPNVSKTSDV